MKTFRLLPIVLLLASCMSQNQKIESFKKKMDPSESYLTAWFDKGNGIERIYCTKGSTNEDFCIIQHDLKNKSAGEVFRSDPKRMMLCFPLISSDRYQMIYFELSEDSEYKEFGHPLNNAVLVSKDFRSGVRKELVNPADGNVFTLIGNCCIYKEGADIYWYDIVKNLHGKVKFDGSYVGYFAPQPVYCTGLDKALLFKGDAGYEKTSLFLMNEADPSSAKLLDTGFYFVLSRDGDVSLRTEDEFLRTYDTSGTLISEHRTIDGFLKDKCIPVGNVVAANRVENVVCYFMVGGGMDNGDFFYYDGHTGEETKISSYTNSRGEKNNFSVNVRDADDMSIVYGFFSTYDGDDIPDSFRKMMGLDSEQPSAVVFIGKDFTYNYLLRFDLGKRQTSLIDLGDSITKRNNYYQVKQGSEYRYYDLEGNPLNYNPREEKVLDVVGSFFDLFL